MKNEDFNEIAVNYSSTKCQLSFNHKKLATAYFTLRSSGFYQTTKKNCVFDAAKALLLQLKGPVDSSKGKKHRFYYRQGTFVSFSTVNRQPGGGTHTPHTFFFEL